MSKTENPMVSICCITYNHEKYIRDAIEGFLMQRTDFPFEIIIHDDASTDKTANIVREYEKKYPRIIKPIYQTENQYSKNKEIIMPLVYSKAQGKYFALCEGDDYWTDPYKLQKQIDAMESHPACNMCFHPASIMNEKGIIKPRLNNKYPQKIKIIPTSEIILNGPAYIPTASMILRSREIEYITHPPKWTSKLKGTHAYDIVVSSLGGGALFVPDIMSIYRQNTESSFSKKVIGDNKFALDVANSICYLYDKLDEMTNYAYKEEFEKAKWRHCQNYLKSIRTPYDYKKIFFETNNKCMPFFVKMSCMLLMYRSFVIFWLIIRHPVLVIKRAYNILETSFQRNVK